MWEFVAITLAGANALSHLVRVRIRVRIRVEVRKCINALLVS